MAKDEALELIWPDTDLERADLAFHRTLGGLRHTLDPDGRAAGRSSVSTTIAIDSIRRSSTGPTCRRSWHTSTRRGPPATGPRRLRLLEDARALYRGEYLDDCPFYGDSAHVEDRRAALRGRCVDLLLALGEGYEQAGDRVSAAAAYRDALAMTDDCPPARAGLTRLAQHG